MRPLVVKTQGGPGKGAIVCSTEAELLEAILIIMEHKQFGNIPSVVIEPLEWKEVK